MSVDVSAIGPRRKSVFDVFLADDCDEIAAGVVKHGDDRCADIGWSLYECHASCYESLVFGVNVIDVELGARYAVLRQGVSERLDGRVARGFEE